MKITLSVLLCSFYFLTVGYAQESSIYSTVQIQLDDRVTVQYLADNGLDIDHVHTLTGGKIEFVLDQRELQILESRQVQYELITADVQAEYLKSALAFNSELKSMNCGLSNFDGGEMGGYHSYDDMINHITKMQEDYPDIVQVIDIGRSIENRIIYAVKISDNVLEDESGEEAAVYYDAVTHAREPMGLETVLYYMWWLLENYENDPESRYLIDHRQIYIVPIVNPDGYVFNQTNNPTGGGLWRKNRRQNSNGTVGVDLNRNYDFDWGELWGSSNTPSSNTYHGTRAFSEPESQAVRDFTAQINPSLAYSCHAYSDVFIIPESMVESVPLQSSYYDFSSEFMPNTYLSYGSGFETIGYNAAGTTVDYLHSQGIFSILPEIGHDFWESPAVICDRVQEMLDAMKYSTWVSGAFASLHSYELIDDSRLWQGEELDLIVSIKNKGLSQVVNTASVAISSPSPKITILQAQSSTTNLSPRQTKQIDQPVRFELSDDFTAGEEIPIEITISQDGIVTSRKMIYFLAGVPEELFSENAEQNLNQWTSPNGFWFSSTMDSRGGNRSIADSPLGAYPNGMDRKDLTLAEPLNLLGTENPFLEFDVKWAFHNFNDFTEIEISTDNGISWRNLKGLHTSDTGIGQDGYIGKSHWLQERISLKEFISGSVLFRFIILSDTNFEADGIYLDNIKVTDYKSGMPVNNEDIMNQSLISVSPNPSDGSSVLKFELEKPEQVELSITTANGKLIAHQELNLNSGKQEIPIQLPSAGVYLINLKSSSANQCTRVVCRR